MNDIKEAIRSVVGVMMSLGARVEDNNNFHVISLGKVSLEFCRDIFQGKVHYVGYPVYDKTWPFYSVSIVLNGWIYDESYVFGEAAPQEFVDKMARLIDMIIEHVLLEPDYPFNETCDLLMDLAKNFKDKPTYECYKLRKTTLSMFHQEYARWRAKHRRHRSKKRAVVERLLTIKNGLEHSTNRRILNSKGIRTRKISDNYYLAEYIFSNRLNLITGWGPTEAEAVRKLETMNAALVKAFGFKDSDFSVINLSDTSINSLQLKMDEDLNDVVDVYVISVTN